MIRFAEPARTWIDIPARISKTGRNRSIPLNPNVSRRLFQKRNNGSLFVFPHKNDSKRPGLSYHGPWRAACKLAKVKNAMPYDLRRSFVTRCAITGMPLLYVAKLLDSSVKMLEGTYAKIHAETMEDIVK